MLEADVVGAQQGITIKGYPISVRLNLYTRKINENTEIRATHAIMMIAIEYIFILMIR